MHWLPDGEFLAEVRRVLKPNGVLAVLGYGVCRLNGNPLAQKVVYESVACTYGRNGVVICTFSILVIGGVLSTMICLSFRIGEAVCDMIIECITLACTVTILLAFGRVKKPF